MFKFNKAYQELMMEKIEGTRKRTGGLSESPLLNVEPSQVVSSKRKLPTILECPVCSCVYVPPIYNCERGHSVCSPCRKNLSKCGLCQSKFTDARNFIAEEILETQQFACEFRSDGCMSMLHGAAYEKHIDDCGYRPIKCHLGHHDDCKSLQMNFRDCLNHLAETHKIRELLGNQGTFSVLKIFYDSSFKDTKLWKGTFLSYDSKTFLTLTVLQSGIFKFSLCILASESEAKNYHVKISFKRPVRHKWIQEPTEVIIPVLPVRDSPSFTQKYNHAQLTQEMLRKFCIVEGDPGLMPSFEWLTVYSISKSSENHFAY